MCLQLSPFRVGSRCLDQDKRYSAQSNLPTNCGSPVTGSGSITAYEGARYYVDIVKDSSGTWVATLAPATTT